ncbi:MAG TPA: M20 family peptidase, partial [Savagea sp.]
MDDHLCCTEEEMINLLRLFVENESGSNDKEGVDRFGRLLKTSFQALGFLAREDVQTDYGN